MQRRLGLVLLLAIALALPILSEAQTTCTPQITLKTSVKLAWDAPTSEPTGITLTGYVIDKQIDSGAWAQWQSVGPTILTVTDSTLQIGHTYFYRVYALSKDSLANVASSPYATMSTTAPPCVTVIGVAPPTNLTATPQ